MLLIILRNYNVSHNINIIIYYTTLLRVLISYCIKKINYIIIGCKCVIC